MPEFRLDGLFDVVNGLFQARNRLAATTYCAPPRLSDSELAELFRGSELAKKIVSLYPKEAMREGFLLTVPEDSEAGPDAEAIAKRWGVAQLVTRARCWGRLFGGAVIWLHGQGDQSLPLSPGEPIIKLLVLDRRFLQVDPVTANDFGEPTQYRISPPGVIPDPTRIVHASRFVRFGGALTEDLAARQNNSWDDSVLQSAWDAVRGLEAAWEALDTLLNDASVAVFKMPELYTKTASNQGEAIQTRFRLLNQIKSYARALLLDTTEEYETVATNFQGVPEAVDRLAQRVSATSGIPVTILLGQAPAGLNATGDSDLRWLNSRLQIERTDELEPGILTIVRALCAQDPAFSGDPEALEIVWPELWHPSDLEQAQAYETRQRANSGYIADEVYLPEEVALSVSDSRDPEVVINRQLRERTLKQAEQDMLLGNTNAQATAAQQTFPGATQGPAGQASQNNSGTAGPTAPDGSSPKP